MKKYDILVKSIELIYQWILDSNSPFCKSEKLYLTTTDMKISLNIYHGKNIYITSQIFSEYTH